MHMMLKCTLYTVSIHNFGSHCPYGDYCGVSLCILAREVFYTLYRARLEPHEDSFQDACVNHNRFDADNESATRIRSPHSKSLAEGNNNHNHVYCNCIPSSAIVGYVACYG